MKITVCDRCGERIMQPSEVDKIAMFAIGKTIELCSACRNSFDTACTKFMQYSPAFPVEKK